MFSFEGRCPGGVPAHPGGHPCGWNGRFEGRVLESQLTPSQEGTVHHLYQEGRTAWRQHVRDGLSAPLAKPPPRVLMGPYIRLFVDFTGCGGGVDFFSQPQASIADTELPLRAPRCLLSTKALSQAEEVEAGKLEAWGNFDLGKRLPGGWAVLTC